jgi:hypothetical protein
MATTVQTSPKKEHDAAKLLKRETANAKKAVAAALANLTKSRNALRKLTDRSTDDVGRGDVNAAVHVVRQRSIAYREAHAKLIGISTPKLRAKEQARLLDNEDGVEGTLARAKAWLELRAVDDRSWFTASTSTAGSTRTATKLEELRAKERHAEKRIELRRRKQAITDEEELLEIREQIECLSVKDDAHSVTSGKPSAHVTPKLPPTCNAPTVTMVTAPNVALNHNAEEFIPVSHSVKPPVSQSVPHALLPNCSISSPIPPPFSDPSFYTQKAHEQNGPSDPYTELITAMTIPRKPLSMFSGDIMEFHPFMSAFHFRVGSKRIPDYEKLQTLYEYLTGEPQELVHSCLYMASNGYEHALNVLAKAYGDPYKLANAYLDQLMSWPPLKNDDVDALHKLSNFLLRCVNAMSDKQFMSALDHPNTLQRVLTKFPPYLFNRWPERAQHIVNCGRAVTLKDMSSFLQFAASAANDPVFGRKAITKLSVKPTSVSTGSKKGVESSFAVEMDKVKPKREFTCFLCDKVGHRVNSCPGFVSLKSVTDRVEALKKKKLCFGCFGRGHTVSSCKRKMICNKCKGMHPTELHRDAQASDHVTCRSVMGSRSRVYHAILPVVIRQNGSDKSVLTYCFLDNGSSGCFMSEELFTQLKPKGKETCIRMTTMHGASDETCVVIDGLFVSSVNGDNEISLPKVYTRPDIPTNTDHIARKSQIAHVSKLAPFQHIIPQYYDDVSVGLLVGCNCSLALEPLQVKTVEGSPYFAVKYRHGWSVQGADGSRDAVSCNLTVTECHSVAPFDAVKALELDFAGATSVHPDEKGLSVEDERFLQFVEKHIDFVDGHYVVPFSIHDRSVSLANTM